MTAVHRFFLIIFSISLPTIIMAQSLFSPAITVNDDVVTYYELDQREKLLAAFGTPGDLQELAQQQLIDESLKLSELSRRGLSLTDAGFESALADFLARNETTENDLYRELAAAGVDSQTFRDFLYANSAWRDFVRQTFAGRIEISPEDIDRVLGQRSDSATKIQVLLSEIILAAPPERMEEAMDVAQQIANLPSQEAFEDAARQVSALPSRANGGRLDWVDLDNYPPALRGLMLGLKPGEISDPLPIPNGVALFQLRGLREVERVSSAGGAIEFATLFLPDAISGKAEENARSIARDIDTCDDLYGIARDMPEEALEREILPVRSIPQDIAIELAKLDPDEISTSLRTDDGDTLIFLMLCARLSEPSALEEDRVAVGNELRSARLSGYADALLANLRASATITIE